MEEKIEQGTKVWVKDHYSKEWHKTPQIYIAPYKDRGHFVTATHNDIPSFASYWREVTTEDPFATKPTEVPIKLREGEVFVPADPSSGVYTFDVFNRSIETSELSNFTDLVCFVLEAGDGTMTRFNHHVGYTIKGNSSVWELMVDYSYRARLVGAVLKEQK